MKSNKSTAGDGASVLPKDSSMDAGIEPIGELVLEMVVGYKVDVACNSEGVVVVEEGKVVGARMGTPNCEGGRET